MKNLNKLILPLFVASFVLAGCASNEPMAPNNAPGAQQPSPQQGQQAQSAPSNTGAPVSNVPVSRFGKEMKCDVLKAKDAQQNCEMQINDMIGGMLESEIISSYDIGRCSELPAGVAKSCQDRLSATGVKGPVPDEEIAMFNDIMRGTPNKDPKNPGITYDSTKCAQLKTPGYKEFCEARLSERADQQKLNQIIQSKDKKGCDTLTTQTMKDDCKRFFGEEVKPVGSAANPAATAAPAGQ